MADVKERLVQLLMTAPPIQVFFGGRQNGKRLFAAEHYADHLLANGVTIPVRCRECKGWCPEEIAKQYGVDRYCTLTGIPTGADDFCSYGERREGE